MKNVIYHHPRLLPYFVLRKWQKVFKEDGGIIEKDVLNSLVEKSGLTKEE